MNSLKSSFVDYVFTLSIEFLLFFLIVFSPFVYGGITFFPLAVIQLTGLLIFIFFIFNLIYFKATSVILFPLWSFGLFLFFSVFQTVKIPLSLTSFLSPSSVKIYQDFLTVPSKVLSITISPNVTWHILLQLVVCFGIFFVVVNYVSTEARLRRLSIALIISGLVYSFIGIANKLTIADNLPSTFTNRNHFAVFIQMIIFYTLGYSFSISNKIWRIINLFLVSVMIIALFCSLSRAAGMCFFLGLLLFFILIKIKKIHKNSTKSFFILVAFITMLIVIIGVIPLTQRINTLMNPLVEYHDRFVMLLNSLHIAKDFPLVGTGLGTFAEIAPKYKTTSLAHDYIFVHNEVAQLFSETGIVGTILILIFIFFIFKEIYFIWLKRRNIFIVFIVMGGMIGLFLALVHSFFDFIFHTPSVLVLFFIIMGMIYRGVYINIDQIDNVSPRVLTIKVRSFLRVLFIFLTLSVVFYTGYLVITRYQAEAIFDKIKDQEIVEKGLPGVMRYMKLLRKIDNAIALNSIDSKYYYKKANVFVQLAFDDKMKDDLVNLDEFGTRAQLLDKAEQLYIKAITFNPTKADYHLKLGWVYKTQENVELAKVEFEKAYALDPTNKVLVAYLKGYLDLKN